MEWINSQEKYKVSNLIQEAVEYLRRHYHGRKSGQRAVSYTDARVRQNGRLVAWDRKAEGS